MEKRESGLTRELFVSFFHKKQYSAITKGSPTPQKISLNRSGETFLPAPTLIRLGFIMVNEIGPIIRIIPARS